MKSFKEFVTSISNFRIVEITLENRAEENADEIGIVSIWKTCSGQEKTHLLLEATGNKNVRLVGQYSVRYDPPRTASTGKGQTPKGDWHLMDRSGEIAAWDGGGKARHNYASGTPIPAKAYKALRAKYGDLTGLKGPILEAVDWRSDQIELFAEDSQVVVTSLLERFPAIEETPGLLEAIERALTSAADAEREACARIAESFDNGLTSNQPDVPLEQHAAHFSLKATAHTIALNIRSRSKSP